MLVSESLPKTAGHFHMAGTVTLSQFIYNDIFYHIFSDVEEDCKENLLSNSWLL